MAILEVGKNSMLNDLASRITYIALFTDDACTTEVSGGSYSRQGVTWNGAVGGSIGIANQPIFDIPAGTTVRGLGFMTALTEGTQLANYDVLDESYAGVGTYTVTSATIDLNK